MQNDTTSYLVPSGDGKSQIAVDLLEIGKAELRLKDVAIVNAYTAPEMLATFNDMWLKLNRSVTQLTYQKNIAENCHRRSVAEAKINCTDEAIKAKGHSKSSADLRSAIVELDSAVQKSNERVQEISFVLSILQGKQQAFYNAYNSVKRLTDGRQLPSRSYSEGAKPEPYQAPPETQDKAPQAVKEQELEPLPKGFRA